MYNKVFITGGTGLLGREITTLLCKNKFEVVALKRHTSKIDHFPKAVHWVKGDLAEPNTYLPALQQADIVIHAAAKVSFNPSRSNSILQFNVSTTNQIATACLKQNIPLIYISSVAALGSLQDTHIDESSNFSIHENNTAYAKSKYLAEKEVWQAISNGLQAMILNPSIILGIPAKWHESTGNFWKQIQKGLRFAPTGITGFVDARDVASILFQLIQEPRFGQAFIVNAENRSYQEFFQQIASSMGKQTTISTFPKWIGEVLWRASSFVRLFGIKAPMSKALHKTMHNKFYYNNSKIEQATGFQFRPIEESIQWVTEHYTSD